MTTIEKLVFYLASSIA